jgi:hypothetical protein
VIEGGHLPKRVTPDMPPGAEVADPSKGTWEKVANGQVIDTGTVWLCNYCSHQTLCAKTEKGRIPIESVVSIGGKAA